MPPSDFAAHTGRYLSFFEREEIAILRAYGYGVRQIARYLGRSPSTVSRELRRNAATRGGQPKQPDRRPAGSHRQGSLPPAWLRWWGFSG
jgi:IS30 family transposase